MSDLYFDRDNLQDAVLNDVFNRISTDSYSTDDVLEALDVAIDSTLRYVVEWLNEQDRDMDLGYLVEEIEDRL